MTKQKKFLVFLTGIVCSCMLSIAIILACGYEEDPYDYYVSFFHNNVQGEHNYGAFYLSYRYIFNNVEPESEQDINADEWAAYLGNGVTRRDIVRAMYNLSNKVDSMMLRNGLIAAGKLPDSLKGNSFLKSITSERHEGALRYYLFAKGVEPYTNIQYDSWNPIPLDTIKLHDAGLEALKLAGGEKDIFLKLRYLYQSQRLLHYSKDYKQAMSVYNKHISSYKTDSRVKGWALSLMAGEMRRLGDTSGAAYIFSKIFAQYPERRIQAYKDYNFCSADVEKVAALAQNDSEKAFIYAIKGFSSTEMSLKNLQKVYNYDPHSEAVGVLLVREINKLEQDFLTTRLNEKHTGNYNFYREPNADSMKQVYINHLQLLQKFCTRLADEKKYPEPGLGYMASAYLTWMEGGHTDEGLALLAKLDNLRISDKLNDQKQLVKLLLSTQKIEKLNEVNEAQLLPLLQWLDTKVASKAKTDAPNGNDHYYVTDFDWNKFAASARDFYTLVLSEAYLKQGDTVKAALCVLKSESVLSMIPSSTVNKTEGDTSYSYSSLPDFWKYYLHSAQVNQVIGLIKNPATSPYLKFLAAPLNLRNNADLYDLLGTTYLREHNYAMSVQAYQKMNISAKIRHTYTEEGADPFISQFRDYPKTFLKKNSQVYDGLMFAQKMLSLQKQAAANPKMAATAYFQMATGLYNASHYGNAYYLISYEWSSTDYGRKNRYSYDDDYVKTKTAEQYYLKARAASADAEFKAKCTYMAAKCAEKQIIAVDNFNWSQIPVDDYDKKVRSNRYFAELKKNYPTTAYYKLAVGECSYLRDYLASSDKKKK